MNRRWDVALLALLIAGGSAPSALDAARPSAAPAAGSNTQASGGSPAVPMRFKVTRPTYVYALPDPKSRVIYIAMPGDELSVVPGGVRAGALRAPASGKECCGSGLYDPDQRIDIVDHVGEGYAPVFHTNVSSAAVGPDEAAGPGQAGASESGPSGKGHGEPVFLREPGGLGSWIQVASSDGRHRGWTLFPKR